MTHGPKLPVPSEHVEQSFLFQWAAAQVVRYPDLRWLYAIPNGGERGQAQAGKLKAQGVQRGYPDIGLDVARGGYHGLRIELKKREGGTLRQEQGSWADRFRQVGYCWRRCDGWVAASGTLVWYLGLPPTEVAR